MNIPCGSRNRDILPYLQVSSLCIWKTGSPIPACGGPRKSSESGSSTADCAECKSLAWTAGGNTERRERGRGEEWKGVRYSTSESAAAWRTFRHGNKYPSPPSFPFAVPPSLPPFLPPSCLCCWIHLSSLERHQRLMPILQFPRPIIKTGLEGGEELALPPHTLLTNTQTRPEEWRPLAHVTVSLSLIHSAILYSIYRGYVL